MTIGQVICLVIRATTVGRDHGRSLYVAASTTFLQRDECDRPDKHRPSGSDPRSGQGGGSLTIFSGVGDALPAVISLLLLQAGDEPNQGPSCYACGQNIRQSDTPLSCHTPACGIITHKQTPLPTVPTVALPNPWRARPTSYHSNPFRPGTRPLACVARVSIHPHPP